MRVIDAQIHRAIRDKRAFRYRAYCLDVHPDGGWTLFMHGKCIAAADPAGNVRATCAGWPTVTTKERINALAAALGSPTRLFTRKHQLRISYGSEEGEPLGANEWFDIVRSPSANAA